MNNINLLLITLLLLFYSHIDIKSQQLDQIVQPYEQEQQT